MIDEDLTPLQFQVKGDTGNYLQLTHCRLCSLEEVTGVQPATHCTPELLQEPEAFELVCQIARQPDVLHESKESLEACHLVKYTFELWWVFIYDRI